MVEKQFSFARMDEDKRLRHVYRQKIETADARKIEKGLRSIYRLARVGLEGHVALIMGITGAGKTTAVRMFTDTIFEQMRAADPSGTWERPEVAATDLRPIVHKTETGTERPIAVLSVNSRPRYNSFLHDAALALQVSLPKRFDFGEASREINNALLKQKVKMFIFDDVQHIIESHMDDYGAADVFKLLAKSRVQLVCIGLPSAEGLIRVNGQLRRLVRFQHMLTPLRCSIGDFPQVDRTGNAVSDGGGRKTAFRNLMAAIDRKAGQTSVLPFDGDSKLSDSQMALRIHQASGGFVGEIMKLIQEATTLAILAGRSKLIMDDFAEAYETMTLCNDDRNWFRIPWPKFAESFGRTPQNPRAAEENEHAKLVEKNVKKREKRTVDAVAGRA
ncbi:TniB family NTP-binding protein [Bradyrhizobium uaiense]|uniref:AAA family ATPase n=1 Tax=Bradyrhizobium uaiense TaxID=2594946 RepID=A0A6P1BK87_9BRAD|nr:AAA family ATPase [Bradyrhizobium uaiense]NEU97991.1 AAA family ATPase [Bradyrhizobium uaiense]